MKIQDVLSRAVGSVSGAHCLHGGALTSVIQASVVGDPRSGQGLHSLAASAVFPGTHGKRFGQEHRRPAGTACKPSDDLE